MHGELGFARAMEHAAHNPVEQRGVLGFVWHIGRHEEVVIMSDNRPLSLREDEQEPKERSHP
jgi:hypothetical protein